MGESTFVNQSNLRGASSQLRNVRQGIDFVLLGVTVALTLFGLLMVYSAGPKFAVFAEKPPDFFLIRQLLWAGVGMVAVGITAFFDYHFYRKLSVWMMLATIGSLFVVMLLGESTLGSTRSILGSSVRPSELAKLVTIIYVSVWLNSKREVLNSISLGLLPLGVILGITAILILAQPDLSAAITIMIIGGLLFFLAGGAWRQIVLVVAVAVLVGWLAINLYPTGRTRVTDYIAGLQNPLNASYHVRRSLEAIINGGVFGVGIGHSSTKFTGLPVAHTDSIFAIVTEETGLLGSGLLLIAYLVILWRGLSIARKAPDLLGQLLAAGISIWITLEAFINMAVMVNLLPHAGNALPFISYGGSSLVVTLAGVGILLNIGRLSEKNTPQGGNTFASVVDLRWRNGWRRVSRPGRSPRS